MTDKAQQQSKNNLEKLRKEAEQNQIKQFIRAYELKQKALKELANIYVNNVLSPHFALTFKAAVVLLIAPAFTNIYYAIRPNSVLAGVMPFAVPLLCFTNYVYFMNKDFQNFCFTNQPDAQKTRQQYQILYEFSYFNSKQNEFMLKLQNFRNDKAQGSNQKIKE